MSTLPRTSSPHRWLLGASFVVLTMLFLACGGGEGAPTATADTPPAAETPPPPTGPVVGQASSADGVEIAYTVWHHGDPGATALVFVHGWQCDRGYWSEQIDTFDDDYTVVTVDLAGHGDSGVDREEWKLASFGGDVAAVVEALELESAVLIGHSMGGPAVLEAAPLLDGRVVGVVGVDTLHNVEFEPPPEQWEGIMAAYRSDYVATCDQFVGSMFLPDSDQELVGEIRQDMCSGPEDIGVALMERFGAYDASDALARASATGVPIRVVNSGAAFPTDVEANRRHAHDFDATILHDVGHFLMLEKPEELNHSLAQVVAELTDEETTLEPPQG